MAMHGADCVISGLAVILWDGIIQPEQKTDAKGAYTQYSLKVAVPNTAPELAELKWIADNALKADSTFKGQLPPGGNWPLVPVDPTAFESRLPAHMAFNCKSRRLPQVFDANGQELNPMVYGPQLYPGAVVQVLVNAYTFNNVSKGVTFGLAGIKIIDATAARLPVGGVDASEVFGAGTTPGFAPPPVGQPASYQPPPVMTGQYVAPAGYPAGGVQPAPNFLAPPPVIGAVATPPPPAGPVMTAKANGMTYAQFKANPAWTDELLRSEGYMV